MRFRYPLVVAIVAALAGTAAADSVGPDSFGYLAKDAGSSFTDISGSGSTALFDTDDEMTSQDLGFDFVFYGTTYNRVSWSANGMLVFDWDEDEQFGEFDNVEFSETSPTFDLPSIAVFWDDLQFNQAVQAGADQSYFETLGSGSGEYFVIQWNDVFGINGTNSGATFQVILFETTNTILFNYLDVDFGDSSFDGGAGATVGIRDADGQNSGYNLVWSHDSASLSDGQSIIIHIVPEPGTLALFGLGLGGLGASAAARRRRRRRAA